MPDPGYLSNAELAGKIVDLVNKYNLFTDEQMNFFTAADDTVQMTDTEGNVVTVPSLAALGRSGDALSVFTSVAAGLAATKSGQYFNVLIGGGEYLALYLNQGGLAVSIARYPSAAGVAGTAFMEDLSSAMAAADAIMLTPFNEFDLDTAVQVSSSGTGFNTVLDELVHDISLVQATPNFIHMVREDLARLANVRTVMVWTQWFSLCDSTSGANPGTVVPAINAEIASKLSSPSQWSVNGQVAGSALQLNGQAGGTQNDASLIRGMKFLTSRGYDVGFVPIVLGWVNTAGLPQSQALVWRGFFNWTTLAAFQTWLTSYKAFARYYIALFQANGIYPKRWLVGSEFDKIVMASPNDQWSLFVAGLKELADEVKAAFPECQVTYASSYSDYGVGASYRLDALWTHPTIDEVGIEWYFRLTRGVSGRAEDILAGLTAGEDIDYTYNLSDDNQRKLSASAGVGKVNETPIPIDASAGIQNVVGFWQGCHFVAKQAGYIAEATPQAGYGRGYDPYGLPGMEGNAVAAVAAGLIYPGTSGSHPPPADIATFLQCDGTSNAGYGKVTTPTYSGGTQSSWSIELDFQVTALPTDNYARVLELANYLEVMLEQGAGFKLGLGGAYYITLSGLDTNRHTLKATLNRSANTLTVVWDGVSSDYDVDSGSAIAIPSASALYLGGYNENYAMTACRIYTFGLFFTRDGQRWGGTFHFDETYAGVRTAWTPKLKRLAATELGFASIAGTCVEPSQFTYADLGTSPMPLPAILDDTTRAIYQSFINKGWYPAEVYSSYGSSFNYAPYEQAYALRETLRYMASLQQRGVMGSITIYNLDARPAAAMAATLQGTLYYTDAPTALFGHSLNGKLAGGSSLFHQKILDNGSIF